jgi:hypothetical protein
MRFHLSVWPLVLPLPLLACGGSDSGGVVVDPGYPTLFDTASDLTSALRAHGLNTTTFAIASDSGTLDRANDRVTGGGLTGDVNASRTLIALDAGGTVTITDGATDYVAMFSAEPTVGDPSFGVVGIPTEIADLPVTATYSGTTNFQIIDGNATYELVGTASVTANFSQLDLDATFSSLDGTRSDGVSVSEDVTNVATVSINDALISGNSFSGGTAEFSSTQITTDLTGAELVESAGGFYGPDADEVGGVVLVDDTATGSLILLGDFVAD